ncbi:MAG: hypothetical protein OIF51_17355 [Cellvibrionaceae bacterium]|nr:hypothetical protein [Cellvibrionaceae bacterium]
MSLLMVFLPYIILFLLALLVVVKVIGWLWRRLPKKPTQEPGPVKEALSIRRGTVVEAKQWHARGGGFHAEFWIKEKQGVEHRYKVEDVHPEVRRGHQVIIYEYAGVLSLIRNQSSGRDIWFIPNGLLKRLYPSFRNPMVPITVFLFVVCALVFGVQGGTIYSLSAVMVAIASAVLAWQKSKSNNRMRIAALDEFFGRAS